ncbi:carbohydrate ABC transporter permease [Paenibacillus sacheonensis]|uniref:ABC transporter permease subunit n=1 Tax=Paenibacillus sacheonensis TaxID=742054 RepID=A0A7X4YPB3_9BACL|nr:sugar ABC transporter permease [Paenibacillus sacheonensis]MBM7565189.1 sn-glycerol 3-phosphate transport system permease protein [Paenibacillus sacheonensis]NBC70033.1 ABC transporter permease subunit [Paenibacillus sacheonensis]
MNTTEAELAVKRVNARTRGTRRSLAVIGKETAAGYLFMAPSLVLFAVFLFYPLAKSVYLSMYLTDPRGRVAMFVGLDNFISLFRADAFWNSLLVTLKFTAFTVPTGLLAALLLAALTFGRLRGMRAFRFIFSLPVALSVSTSSVIWSMLYHPTTGTLNYFLSKLGIAPVQWLTDPAWALVSVSIMTIWMNSGFSYIVLLSGLQGIADDIFDSARIDGAGPFRSFVQILVPLVSPTLFFLCVISVMSAFQSFGQMNILTKGGPAGSTEVFVYSIYKEAFINYQFGTGSALALVLFAFILLLTLLQFRLGERKVHYH